MKQTIFTFTQDLSIQIIQMHRVFSVHIFASYFKETLFGGANWWNRKIRLWSFALALYFTGLFRQRFEKKEHMEGTSESEVLYTAFIFISNFLVNSHTSEKCWSAFFVFCKLNILWGTTQKFPQSCSFSVVLYEHCFIWTSLNEGRATTMCSGVCGPTAHGR